MTYTPARKYEMIAYGRRPDGTIGSMTTEEYREVLQLQSAQGMPPIIALCGHPKSGKSTAQKILHNSFGYVPLDDGAPLREIAMRWFGLTEHQVTTQEGKAEYVDVNGQRWQVRDILGTIGDGLEEKFGEHIIPFMAFHHYRLFDSVERQQYSFGSVRKTQGHWLRARGGKVIEIANPLAPPSPYKFDKWDPTSVDVVVQNDALAEGATPEEAMLDLELKLADVLG